MEVKIKDTTKEISVAFRAAGYNVNDLDVETILNIVDFIRQNKDTTLLDIIRIQEQVKGLFSNEKSEQ
jgi:hypothetical protein